MNRKVKIGKRCTIQSNVVIGESGFVYSEENGIKTMIKHFWGVNIGDNSYIASSIIKNQLEIGKNVTVGMGSVVIKDTEDYVTIVGV